MSDYNYYDENNQGQQPDYNNGYNNNNNYNPYQKQEKPKKEKKSDGFGKKLLKVVAIALVFGLVAGGTFSGVVYLLDSKTGAADKIESAAGDTDSTAKPTLSTSTSSKLSSTATASGTTVTDVSDLVDNVMPSIVQVTAVSIVEYQSPFFFQSQSYESTSAGSGIIISQDDSYVYIATNNHVVEGASDLTITFSDGSAVKATVQGTSEDNDLAVVKVAISDIDASTLSTIKVATLGDSDELEVGESAIVIGNALGYGQSVTTGVISAVNRELTSQDDYGNTTTNTVIQTDAAVNPGNSGGALLNSDGQVVGIVSAKYSSTSVEGVGYALPITQASTIIESLMNGEEVSTAANDSDNQTNTNSNASIGTGDVYLGVTGVDISENSKTRYNITKDVPNGAYVLSVTKGSPAEAGGIQKYDIITGFNGTSVSSFQEIQNMMSSLSAGDTVKVEVCTAASDYTETQILNITLETAE